MPERAARPKYLHGYTDAERDRLYAQARFLAPRTFEGVDFARSRRVIEVGCGVGAEIEILLERFPHLEIRGIDAEPGQIARARRHLRGPIRAGRVSLAVGDARALDEPDGAYDGAFLCWVLEHVARPLEVLRELHRVLAPGAPVCCDEVLNATLHVHPRCPALDRYWDAMNEHQIELGGDPDVGARLGNLFKAAGFRAIETEPRPFLLDDRAPRDRARMFDYFADLLWSSAPGLVAAGRVTKREADAMRRDMRALGRRRGAVFFYSFVQARAKA